jgi:nucleoside-diphosphate-sugar epimerase
MHVLVTGAGGFIGGAAVTELVRRGHRVRALSTRALDFGPAVECIRVPRWRGSSLPMDARVLAGVDVVIHLAARAHVVEEVAQDPLQDFRDVNVAPTVALAQLAIEGGTPKMIFASSIGVNGNVTLDAPFTEASEPAPTEPYAVSKWEAECELDALARVAGLTVVTVRLPLVYGCGVKGNFLRLLKLVASGLPLPLGAVRNTRNYLGLRNACDFLATCAESSAAKGLYLISDVEPISTPQLIATLATSMHRKARLVPVPMATLNLLARTVGRSSEVARLTGSLRVDSSHARRVLGWRQPVSLDAGLAEMADWYCSVAPQQHTDCA